MYTNFGIISQAEKAFKRSTILPIKSTDNLSDETPREFDIFNIFW